MSNLDEHIHGAKHHGRTTSSLSPPLLEPLQSPGVSGTSADEIDRLLDLGHGLVRKSPPASSHETEESNRTAGFAGNSETDTGPRRVTSVPRPHLPRRPAVAGSDDGGRVAILVARGFEQVELTSPRDALEAAGASTAIVSPEHDRVLAWRQSDWGDWFDVDFALHQVHARDFDALLLPGGVLNPDRLRQQVAAIRFIKDFFEAGKLVAAICHGAWSLIDAGAVRGRTVTSYPSLKTDLINAGAEWVDEPVVIDQDLITSRDPDDLPAFNQAVVSELKARLKRQGR
jgi:protease I